MTDNDRYMKQMLINHLVMMDFQRVQLLRQQNPTPTEAKLVMRMSGAMGATEEMIRELDKR